MGGSRRIITLLSDFGTEDGYVAAMKGVILEVAPDACIVDATHEIPPHDIRAGAWALGQYWRYYPKDTIHVAVVDPGVGTEREGLIVLADGYTLIAPNNGILSWVELQAPDRTAYRIRPGWHRPGGLAATFHGRDIFAYTAGVLASGLKTVEEIAEPMEDTIHPGWAVVRREGDKLRGQVVHVDHFGNVITNISERDLRETGWRSIVVEAGNTEIHGLKRTYGDVAPGEKLALIDSSGLLELACRGRSAADRMILCIGDEVVVREGP